MHWQEEDRWQEVKFYILCKNLFESTNKNMQIIYSLIDGLEKLGQYNNIVVKQCAFQILSDMRYKPSKRELVVLSAKANLRIKPTLKILKINSATYYQYLREEHPLLFSRLPAYKLEQVKKFLEAYYIIKGALSI